MEKTHTQKIEELVISREKFLNVLLVEILHLDKVVNFLSKYIK